MSFPMKKRLKCVRALSRDPKPCCQASFRPGIEALESRVVPAFDLTIGTGGRWDEMVSTSTVGDHTGATAVSCL